jgi:putative ABC transport system ATP-binding protein
VAVPLIYGRSKSTTAKARQALERVGLAKRARHKPSELSGGERQRVAIARAIVNQPRLILADEPTGNLDSRTGEQIMEIFHSLHQEGATIVLVTHEMQVAAQARRLIRMKDGKIIEDRPITDELRHEMMQTAVRYVGKPSRRPSEVAPMTAEPLEAGQ